MQTLVAAILLVLVLIVVVWALGRAKRAGFGAPAVYQARVADRASTALACETRVAVLPGGTYNGAAISADATSMLNALINSTGGGKYVFNASSIGLPPAGTIAFEYSCPA